MLGTPRECDRIWHQTITDHVRGLACPNLTGCGAYRWAVALARAKSGACSGRQQTDSHEAARNRLEYREPLQQLGAGEGPSLAMPRPVRRQCAGRNDEPMMRTRWKV